MRVNFKNLVRQLLPPHKRQSNRLLLLQTFLSPLQSLFDFFTVWRSEKRMLIHINSQVRVLEGYLRYKYHDRLGIKIQTYDDGLVAIGVQEEGIAMMGAIGLEKEELFLKIPLEGEIRNEMGGVDFIVRIPLGVDIEAVRADIEFYKTALVRYNIIQN